MLSNIRQTIESQQLDVPKDNASEDSQVTMELTRGVQVRKSIRIYLPRTQNGYPQHRGPAYSISGCFERLEFFGMICVFSACREKISHFARIRLISIQQPGIRHQAREWRERPEWARVSCGTCKGAPSFLEDVPPANSSGSKVPIGDVGLFLYYKLSLLLRSLLMVQCLRAHHRCAC